MRIAICDDIPKEQGGVPIPIPRRSSEEVQKTYMEFCRKEVLK